MRVIVLSWRASGERVEERSRTGECLGHREFRAAHRTHREFRGRSKITRIHGSRTGARRSLRCAGDAEIHARCEESEAWKGPQAGAPARGPSDLWPLAFSQP